MIEPQQTQSTNSNKTEDRANVNTPLTHRLAKLLLAVVAMLLAGSTVVMVDEAEYVIVERLGHIVAVYDRSEDRGLHFKLPWPIDAIRRFDRRVQLFDPPGREIFTRDKKNITIDTYVCWKIAEPDSADGGDSAERLSTRSS